MAIYQGVWDCPNCKSQNPGPELTCRGCGRPRDKNVSFYLPENAPEVTDTEELHRAKSGPDKICPYCKSTYPATFDGCPHCSARESEESLAVKDYDQPKEKHSATAPDFFSPQKLTIPPTSFQPPRKNAVWPWVLGGSGLVLIIALLGMLFKNDTHPLKITSFEWQRSVHTEELKPFIESGWEVPRDGVILDRERKVKDHEDVVTGYKYEWEDYEYEAGKKKVICGKTDLGNGYFEDKICEEPIMKNERRQIRVEVKEERPIYATWYVYRIKRWVKGRELNARGSDRNPVWPVFSLAKNERETSRYENLVVYFKDDKGKVHKKKYPHKEWISLDPAISYVGEFNRFGLHKVRTPETP